MTTSSYHHPGAAGGDNDNKKNNKNTIIEQVCRDVFFVRGSVTATVFGCLKFRCGRNMTIVRDNNGNHLTLINSTKLCQDGLAELERLGQVKHVVRLTNALFTTDDLFYKERYGATIWAPRSSSSCGHYDYLADKFFTADDPNALPISDSTLFVMQSSSSSIQQAAPAAAEALVLLDRPQGKVFVSGDSLQNWFCDPCSSTTKIKLSSSSSLSWYHRLITGSTMITQELEARLLEWEFDHVIPAHGEPHVVKEELWKNKKTYQQQEAAIMPPLRVI